MTLLWVRGDRVSPSRNVEQFEAYLDFLGFVLKPSNIGIDVANGIGVNIFFRSVVTQQRLRPRLAQIYDL